MSREPVRVTAPLDDPVLGTEPLVIDPTTGEANVTEMGRGRGRVRDAEGRSTRIVMLEAAGAAPGIDRREVLVDGWSIVVEVEPAARAALRERASRAAQAGGQGGSIEVRAIIPGRVLSVAVAAGDAVQAGQPLIVVEAMKMQNELRAPRDGTVERVSATAGATIELGDLLLVLA